MSRQGSAFWVASSPIYSSMSHMWLVDWLVVDFYKNPGVGSPSVRVSEPISTFMLHDGWARLTSHRRSCPLPRSWTCGSWEKLIEMVPVLGLLSHDCLMIVFLSDKLAATPGSACCLRGNRAGMPFVLNGSPWCNMWDRPASGSVDILQESWNLLSAKGTRPGSAPPWLVWSVISSMLHISVIV